MKINLDNQYYIALAAAKEASKTIMQFYNSAFEKFIKEDGSPVTQADLASSKVIFEHLDKTNIPIVGEELEKAPYQERKKWTLCWCVDPLDGTKEFIKKNGEFVVNIALIENNVPVFGVIASPISQKIIFGGSAINGAYETSFDTIHDPAAWVKLNTLKEVNVPITIISSRSHYVGNLLALARILEKTFGPFEGKRMGSALKFFDLCKNQVDVYPRLAPTMEWDIAAGQAIYKTIGGIIVDIKTGKELTYNKPNLLNPHFIAGKKKVIDVLSTTFIKKG